MIRTVLILVALLSGQVARADPPPLVVLAERIPASAAERIVLSDVAASAAEASTYDDVLSPDDQRLSVYAPLTLIDGFDLFGSFAASRAGLRPVLGFGLDDIEQIATWTAGAEAPAVIFGVEDRVEAIVTALTARGFRIDDRGDRIALVRGDDLSTDPLRAEEDPFAQREGHSARFAFDGDALLFARSDEGLEGLMQGTGRLTDDPDVRAILSTAYGATQNGRVLEILLLGDQITRADAVASGVGTGPGAEVRRAELMERAGMRRDPLPAFARHGLILWQEGLRVTGALAIPYENRADAETAYARIDLLLATVRSIHADGSFDELLPYGRDFRIVEADGRAVLLLSFEEEIPETSIMPMMLVTNPYDRLRDFQFSGDLDVLIGGAAAAP